MPAGLPNGTEPPKVYPDHIIRMTAVDVPAFQTEDHMPPEHELRYRVNFVYSEDGFESDPDHFWKKYDKKQNEQTEKFMDRRNSMQEKVSQIILPADSKLRKIYARCQQVTNLSFERGDSVVRQKFKPNENVDDVWKWRGHRARHQSVVSGLDTRGGIRGLLCPARRKKRIFFQAATGECRGVGCRRGLVKSDGKDLYLDPATKFAPYGLLPWPETGVNGLRIDKLGGTWIKTPLPDSAETTVVRQADLKLGEDGGLEGPVKVTYKASKRCTSV
jgi:hypothetical protein